MIVILTWPPTYIKEHLATICSGEYSIIRRCPACHGRAGEETVVGHGRRGRRCDSSLTTAIVVRRGRCKNCGTPFTFLPCFVRPFHQYAVPVQAEALERYLRRGEPGPQGVAPLTAAAAQEHRAS